MKQKKMTLADIAKLAGVSKSTVSFVLNGHAQKHRINETTVKKVQAVVAEYQYSPSMYARALKSKRTYTLGIVIPDLANMGFANTVKKLEKLARNRGYQLLIACSEDDPQQEQAAAKSLLDRQVDLLMVATAMSDDRYYRQVKQSTPILFFDRAIEGAQITTIKTDAFTATKDVVVRLCGGANECAYIGGQLELSPSKERFAGYQTGTQASGIEFNRALVKHRDYQPESGYQMISEICNELNRLPERLFIASYSLLEGVLRYLSEHQLLGERIKIATFDNYAILDCLPIKIDSIEQDCDLIAECLFANAEKLLSAPHSPIETIVLPAKLHIR